MPGHLVSNRWRQRRNSGKARSVAAGLSLALRRVTHDGYSCVSRSSGGAERADCAVVWFRLRFQYHSHPYQLAQTVVPILCLPVVTANAMIPVSPSDVSHPYIGLTAATPAASVPSDGPSAWKVKREAGAIVFNAGAAPATVSDEPSPVPLGIPREGGDQAATREPGDLPSRTVLWRRRRGGVHRTGASRTARLLSARPNKARGR